MTDRGRPVLNDDFSDFLTELKAARVDFLLVGAWALAVHGVPRATGDMDIFVRPSAENAERIMRALGQFGAPAQAHGLTHEDLAKPGTVYQMGLPPRRIDVLTAISGVSFDEAAVAAVAHTIGAVEVPVIGRAALVRNKLASARPKDLADAAALGSSDE